MKFTQKLFILSLAAISSGCSTFNFSSTHSTKEQTNSTPTVEEHSVQSQTPKANTPTSLPQSTKEEAPVGKKSIELNTQKAGSKADTEIPLEKNYPFQTQNPRFSVIEKDTSENSTVEFKKTPFLFDRIVKGYQIDYIEHQRIKKFRQFYLNNLEYIETVLERSRPYLFFIVEEIEKRGLPMELALLPVIESAYLTNATSRSNAAGLWQFIPTTGRYFGLKQNWWSDQRRDVVLSTRSALDYLKELNIEFNGDWYLSIAAYNGGRGTIAKAIKRNKSQGLPTDYFSLNLSKETSNYVPKLIALVDVVRNSHLYNLNVPEIPNTPFFTLVKTPGQIDMAKLIDSTSLNKDVFHQLNAGFKRWASSPEGPHRVVVPINSNKAVSDYLATQSAKPNIQWRNHKLKRGDTLYDLAREYNVSIRAIKTINNLKSNRLRAGKTILIPLRSA